MKTNIVQSTTRAAQDTASRLTYSPIHLAAAFIVTFVLLGAFQSVRAQSDDFNDGNDAGWTHYDPLAPFGAGGTFSFPAGGYRIQAPASPNPGALGVARAGSLRNEAFYSNFSASVDLVAWDNSLAQGFGLAARISQPGLGTTDGYIFYYAPNLPTGAAAVIARLTDEGDTPIGDISITLNSAQDYRFTFSGSGANLSAQIFGLADLVNPLVTVNATDATYASGVTGIFEAAALGSGQPLLDATFDNFQVVPEPSSITLLGLAALVCFAGRRRCQRRGFGETGPR